MAAATPKSFFAVVLVLGLVGQGFCQCDLSNIMVAQSLTGKNFFGSPEFEVNVTNNCVCSQKLVFLNCEGFYTDKEDVDPAVFRKEDDGSCIVNDGQDFAAFESVVFNYVADYILALTPNNSILAC